MNETLGRRLRGAVLILVSAASLASAAPAGAPGPDPAARPRIGLALGGGGARGLAHIGVLRWLEEHRIPVDVIAGTSMGGLVAGGYGTGMSPEEIGALMRTTDWDAMFVSDSPFEHKTFRRKQDRRAFSTQLEFGLKHGLTLPQALNAGQQVTLMLDRIAAPYYDIRSFDDLPTPFRCVATDLKTADSIVLGAGSLSQAMRATMAIPGVFTPVSIGEWLLVDGGILNNVPADVARAMGADVVVAVNVSSSTPIAESLFALLGRTLDTMMAVGVRKGLKEANVVIEPDLAGLDSMSWRRCDETADRGYRAAEKLADKLLPYAVSEEEFAAHLASRRARRRTTVPAPAGVKVEGVTGVERASIAREMAGLVGVPFDPVRVERAVLRLAGTDRYECVSYRLETGTEGPVLDVHARPKPYGPPFLSMGLLLNNVDASNFAASLVSRTTLYDLVGRGSEARVDLALGTRQAAAAEFYKPLRGSRVFAAARLSSARTPRHTFEDRRVVAEYTVERAGAGLDLGVNTGRRSELRFGYDVAHVRGRLSLGSRRDGETEGSERFASLRFAYDGQDSPVVPSRGLLFTTELRRYFKVPSPVAPGAGAEASPRRFWQGELSGSLFHRALGRDRVFGAFGAGTTFGDVPFWERFSLGGPVRMGAFAKGELAGANYLTGAAGYLKQMGRLPDIVGGNVFAGGWLEGGSAFDRRASAAWHANLSGGVVVETLLGPMFAGGSIDFEGHGRLYVSVGPFF